MPGSVVRREEPCDVYGILGGLKVNADRIEGLVHWMSVNSIVTKRRLHL